ncbi:MAG: sulfatase-like hydrolase/transferase [Planctomycetes bacterium]|nr:sulfatase-like hydrolase/transferase [Planctomycetota bacterium]
MTTCHRGLAASILLALFASLAAAQAPLPRGPLHDTAAARARLLEQMPDLGERDILLITLDCTAMRLLPIYGGEGPAMPNLEAFANESVVFLQAWSADPNRLGGAVAIHQSLYPDTVRGLGGASRLPSLASRLGDAGFLTWGILRPEFFEPQENLGELGPTFDVDRRMVTFTRNPATMLVQLERRLDQRRSGERLFGWIHLEHTWPPATVHPGFQSAGYGYENHYRAVLAMIDAFLGDVALRLKTAKADQKTIVVLAGLTGLGDFANTGNELRQDRLDAGTLRVPLIIHSAGLKPERIIAPVETVDVAPSLLDLVGLGVPGSMQGRSFVDLLADAKARNGRPTAVFADLMEYRGDPATARRRFVSDGRGALSAGVEADDRRYFAIGGDGEVDEDQRERLLALLEDHEIYTATCAEFWGRGMSGPVVLDEPMGQLGRARFLATRGRLDEARELVGRLVQREGEHLEATLTVAIDEDLDPSGMAVKELLQHPRAKVRALAGAWLAMHGRSEVGLDQTLATLSTTREPELCATILDALGQSGNARAREAILALDLRGDDLLARRDLALVRLGDADAIARLPRRFLTPRAGYDRLLFLEAIGKHMPEKLVGLCRLYLEDGDGDATLVRAVLDRLDADHGHDVAASLAASLDQLDSELREEVVGRLRRWRSFAAAAAVVTMAPKSAENAAFAARVLLTTPGLLSSPFVPGVRFDHFCSRFEDPAKRRLDRGADLIGAGLEFTLELDGKREGWAVVLFEIGKGPEDLTDGNLRFEARFNEGAWMRTELLQRQGKFWVWAGRLVPGSLEPGENKVLLRVGDRERRPLEAHALGFVVLPDRPTARELVAGIDLRPLEGAALGRAGGPQVGDARGYEIWMRRDPFGPEQGEIRVLAGGRTFARFALSKFRVPSRLQLALPDWAKPDDLLELQAVDVPVESGLAAVLYGIIRQPDPKAR